MKRYIITLIVVTTIASANGGQCSMGMCIGPVCQTPSDTETIVSSTETVVSATETTRLEKFVYTCPMHPEIISEKAGKCPKCKMNLEIKKSDETVVSATETTRLEKFVYTCPMHPEIISEKAGKCPKCKMNLEIKKSDTYYCPHENTKLIKEGKKLYCPKCKHYHDSKTKR